MQLSGGSGWGWYHAQCTSVAPWRLVDLNLQLALSSYFCLPDIRLVCSQVTVSLSFDGLVTVLFKMTSCNGLD